MQAKTETGSLAQRRREFLNYSTAKADEVAEMRKSDMYYHGKQYTAEQIKTLRRRNQPIITFNHIDKKVNGIVGTIRRLRTDPKAFPRTVDAERGAEVATQVTRYILDASEFENIETLAVLDAAKVGIGVSEMTIVQGDKGDPDIGYLYVDFRTFFYDPRSTKLDFSDCRYMGTYKWVSEDEIEEIAPGMGEKALGQGEGDGTYSTEFDTDRELQWADDKGRVRLVDHWYIKGGKWHWCLHVGSVKIDEGESPFVDEKGRSICKYFAFSYAIDEQGDRYGAVRNLIGPQDAINQHRSKAVHIMNTRQALVRKGAVEDIEKFRREMMRPDGLLEYEGAREDIEVISPDQAFLQQTTYYQDAKAQIETFGPNPALLGEASKSASGRAMALAQQAGLAELGPFLQAYRMWKLAQYKAGWTAVQKYWSSERWIRVTDDDRVAGFLQVNTLAIDETGAPSLVNQLGAIDVDITMDEGPDTETMMQDVFETLQSVAAGGTPIPPQVILELAPLQSSVKDKIMKLMSEPNPEEDQAKQIALEGEAAKVEKTKSETALNITKAQTEGIEAVAGPMGPDPFEVEMKRRQMLAETVRKEAEAERAQLLARREALTPIKDPNAGPTATSGV